MLVLVSYLFSLNANAEIFSKYSTVNALLSNEKYDVIGVITIDKQSIVYNLKSNGRIKPKLISCIYTFVNEKTVCYKP
jgi:hypothetical protein